MAMIPAVVAQAETAPSELFRTMSESKWDLLNRPQELTEAVGQLGIVWAVIFVVLGAVCILSGYRWHKAVILVLALLALSHRSRPVFATPRDGSKPIPGRASRAHLLACHSEDGSCHPRRERTWVPWR